MLAGIWVAAAALAFQPNTTVLRHLLKRTWRAASSDRECVKGKYR
jgi:hypothetical protein